MPKYTLPPLKKKKGQVSVMEPDYDDEWMRRIHIPVNKEVLEALEVGESATITLTGKVVGLTDSEREGRRSNRNVDFLIKSVEVPSANPFERLAEEDD